MGDMADMILDSMWDDEYYYQQPKTCVHCGTGGLQWSLTNDGWRLYNGDEIHKCQNFKRITIIEEKRNG